jgi:DnaK suppressor protein
MRTVTLREVTKMKKSTTQRTSGRTSKKDRLACIRGKLLERRRRLLGTLSSSRAHRAAPGGRIPEDTADMAFHALDQDTSLQIGTAEAAEVGRIDAALRRLEDGTYGVCQECGCKIRATRLKALPSAESCLECQRAVERRGDISYTLRLRDLEALGSAPGEEDEGDSDVVLGRSRTRFE